MEVARTVVRRVHETQGTNDSSSFANAQSDSISPETPTAVVEHSQDEENATVCQSKLTKALTFSA